MTVLSSTMGRNLSPIVRQELANLDKDADSRKSAMKALESYVKGLDFKAVPVFLENISETKEIPFTISLYEVLARVHGVKIVPLIDSIMGSIVKTLGSSAGSFSLHQACSKVVPAIAKHGIGPTTPEEKKRHIIHSLCKPLSDSLSSSQESLTSGAALCLKALVESDNWRFASDEMVNRVCQNVAVALEGKSSQTNAHMALVMALAKRNALIVEAYARLFIQSGLRVLNAGLKEGNSQKRLSAIQMVNFLMKCLDPRSTFSELESIIEVMEKCESDKMAFVKGAAFEALQTAKEIAIGKKPKHVRSPASVTGSNFTRGENNSGDGDHSSASVSPESRALDFLPGYEYAVESPISTNFDYEQRSVNRKLWSTENGWVDVSLKDGLSSLVGNERALLEHSANHEFSNGRREFAQEFSGFMDRNPRHGVSRSTTPSPQRSRTQITVDNIEIFTTPRKLIHSLQDSNETTLDCSEKQNRRLKSLSYGNIDWSRTSKYDQNCFSDHVKCDCGVNESLCADGEFQSSSESVSLSSTNDLPGDADVKMPSISKVVPENRNVMQLQNHHMKRTTFQKTTFKLVCGLSFALLAMVTPLIWINSQDEGHYLVPT